MVTTGQKDSAPEQPTTETRFTQIYNSEWTQAFDILKESGMEEDNILKALLDLVQVKHKEIDGYLVDSLDEHCHPKSLAFVMNI